MDAFAVTAVGDVGLGGLVVIILLSIVFGRLVPRSTHQDALRDRDYWREAAQTNAATTAEVTAQNTQLIRAAETGVLVSQALHRNMDDAQQGAGQ